MQFRDHYLNCKLADVPYLLPYGQDIADHASGAQVNSSGARLWDAICRGAGRADLLAMLRESYAAVPEDEPQLEKDLDDFLNILSERSLLLPDDAVSPYRERFLRIGPLRVSLRCPDGLWDTYFSDFSCTEEIVSAPAGMPDQQIAVLHQNPLSRPNGEILIRTKELLIAATSSRYLFLPLLDGPLTEMHVARDGSTAALYCRPLHSAEDIEAVFHAIRFAFLIAAQRHGLFVIHSASLLYQDKAWLFSGSSGTGKSTHTRLWRDIFGTPLLNGDLNMLGIENGRAMCYGLPWCGTSGIRTPENHPLGGVIFLKKAAQNQVVLPTPDKKILYLTQRLISPAWTGEQLAESIAFCERLAGMVPLFRLHCTREPEAAHVMKEAIDDCSSA